MLVLDTNAILSALSDPSRLGRKTQRLITRSIELYISPVSIFEIAMKNMLGKIKLDQSLRELIAVHKFVSLPFKTEDALGVYSFPSLIRHDPFDRMILATALANNASLITSDRKLLVLGFDWIIDSSL